MHNLAKLRKKKNSHISAPRQKFKNLVSNFFDINMRCLYVKFQPSSFPTEGEVLGWKTDESKFLVLRNFATISNSLILQPHLLTKLVPTKLSVTFFPYKPKRLQPRKITKKSWKVWNKLL